jgi:hypothetical protein
MKGQVPMGSNAKKKTTFAKLNREATLRDRRARKEARKVARKLAAAAPPEAPAETPAEDGEDETATPVDQPAAASTSSRGF